MSAKKSAGKVSRSFLEAFFFFVFLILIFLLCRPELKECCKAVKDQAKEYVRQAASHVKSYRTQRNEVKKQLEVCEANMEKQISCNKKIIEELRRELGTCRARVSTLEAMLRDHGQAALALGAVPKGLCSFVFVRSKNPHAFPESLSQVALLCQQQWNQIYPTNNLTSGISGEFVYGETSFLTMARICHVIRSELKFLNKPLQSGDVLLDWGCGAGKWLCFARQLLGVTKMVALGIEAVEGIVDICQKNLCDVRLTNLVHAESHTFTSFCPARVVVNYDGGNQAMQNTVKGRIHRRIMRTAFCSPTVDVVVSTRLNWETFWSYFSKHLHNLHGSVWKCIYIEKCGFGGSRFTVNVWFRLSPMQNFNFTHRYDQRMQELHAGLLFGSSEETHFY
jgi:hypothetical protein